MLHDRFRRSGVEEATNFTVGSTLKQGRDPRHDAEMALQAGHSGQPGS